MKNVLLIIALALLGFRAAAQDYRPFVEEGKSWRIVRISASSQSPAAYLSYKMAGDTIIAGKTWKKVYEGTNLERYWILVREENKCVYFCPYVGAQTDALLYDFNVKVGDSLFFYDIFEYSSQAQFEAKNPLIGPTVVNKVEELENSGHRYRQIVVDYGDRYSFENAKDIWTESIGSSIHPFFRHTYHNALRKGSGFFLLETFVVGDEVIYHREITGLTTPQVNPITNDAIYDLSGRRLQAIPQRGVYIVNGKKYIR